jgi:iron(III) transport system ATP-binding protein
MSQGRVVQDGSAEDLYHRPRTRFVAEFIGRVNLLPAQVVDVADGAATLAALDRHLVVRHDGRSLQAGDAVQLVLRPESLEIVRDDDPRAALQGVVTTRTFLGEKVEYRVACGDTTLQVVRTNSGPGDLVPAGMAIGLAIAADAAAILREDAE